MFSRSQIDSFKKAYGDSEERHLRNESQVNVGLPMQLRAMREMRGWTQQTLAEKLDTTQNTISRLESSRAHAPNISTLLRLAEVFDVALLVRFAPFSDFFDYNSRASHKSVAVPSFDADVEDIEKRHAESLEELAPPQSAQGAGGEMRPKSNRSAIDAGLPSQSPRKPVGASRDEECGVHEGTRARSAA